MKKNADRGYEKTKPIQTQFKANQSQVVKTGTTKTQDTRPKIQILSLKSEVWKEGRKAEKVDFLHGQKTQSKKNQKLPRKSQVKC